jgi:hypothetical protein
MASRNVSETSSVVDISDSYIVTDGVIFEGNVA